MDDGSGAGEKLVVRSDRGPAEALEVGPDHGETRAGSAGAGSAGAGSAGVDSPADALADASAGAADGAGGAADSAVGSAISGRSGEVRFRSDGQPTSSGWVSSSDREADGWSVSLMGGIAPRSDSPVDASFDAGRRREPCSAARHQPDDP
jgi:hypothetical protein